MILECNISEKRGKPGKYFLMQEREQRHYGKF